MIDARANFDEVEQQFRLFLRNVEKVTKLVQAKIALDLFTAVIKRSPVDTGRFRWNWMLSIGEMSLSYDDTAGGAIKMGSKRKSAVGAGASRAEAATTAGNLLTMKVGQSVFITNNTPYGWVLETGHSTQAPDGVVLVSVLSIVERARRGLSYGATFG